MSHPTVSQFLDELLKPPGGQQKIASQRGDVAQMSDADLVRLHLRLSGAREEEIAKVAEQAAAPSADVQLDYIALETLAGECMAYAYQHEAVLAKQACLSGKCRVCKTNERASTASTCAACGGV